MLIIDDILRLLEDGKWHDLREIMYNSRLPDPEIGMFIDFLSEFDFIEVDKRKQKLKLTQSLYDFVRRIKIIEDEAVRKSELP